MIGMLAPLGFPQPALLEFPQQLGQALRERLRNGKVLLDLLGDLMKQSLRQADSIV